MAGGAVRQQHQFVPPLRQRDEQREQDRADEQPVADDDVDGDGACDGAQHETDGERQHVENHDVLQGTRVQQLQAEVGVATSPNRQLSANARGREPPRRAPPPPRAPRPDRQRAGGDRPAPLQRMPPIALAIRDVVDQIDHARQDAEDREGCGSCENRRGHRTARRQRSALRRPGDSWSTARAGARRTG